MKRFVLVVCIIILGKVNAQNIDTLLQIGDHKIHFKIQKGTGIPILFESGAGDNLSIWNSIIEPISKITASTIITYDREGFGKSSINSIDENINHHGILNSLIDLEKGLEQLGYSNEIIIVAHSYGGHLAKLYANKHPEKVKAIMFIDATHNFYAGNDFFEKESAKQGKNTLKLKTTNPGMYFLASNFKETIQIMESITVNSLIPMIDVVNGKPLFKEKEKNDHWEKIHHQFASQYPNCKEYKAIDCSHYIWLENPTLIINLLIDLYINTASHEQNHDVINRFIDFQIINSNKPHK